MLQSFRLTKQWLEILSAKGLMFCCTRVHWNYYLNGFASSTISWLSVLIRLKRHTQNISF